MPSALTTFGPRLIVGAVVLIAMLAVNIVIRHRNTTKLHETAGLVSSTHTVISALDRVLKVPVPKPTLARIPFGMAGGHELNWLESITGKQKISSPFEFAAKLTEVMLLGVVSLRAGAKIHYDAANMRITNRPRANADPNEFLTREYRRGWA